MSIAPGRYTLGPQSGELRVHTGRKGGAKKAGHDLVIEVKSWNATMDVADDPASSSVGLSADGGSLRVRDGSGGMGKLGDDDKQAIARTIDKEVLRRGEIRFRSTAVQPGSGANQLRVRGELELAGTIRPVELELRLADDGRLTAEAVIKQTDWGIKPYSALFGALRVADEVKVTVKAQLQV